MARGGQAQREGLSDPPGLLEVSFSNRLLFGTELIMDHFGKALS